LNYGTGVTEYQASGNVITLGANLVSTDVLIIQLQTPTIWDNYGSYAYTSLVDIVNNFMVAYVGLDKLLPRANRSDVIFHAKRGLQEFSYDTLKSVNSKEPILQDNNGDYTQGDLGQNLQPAESETDKRWKTNNNLNITGQITDEIFDNANVYDWEWWKLAYGRRYGLNPETSQKNGWFTINEREGKFSFSSDLANQLIIIEYISDGLQSDLNSKVPKMAEDALYAHIMHSMVASRANFPEYIVQRYRRERSAKLRNAKIRLSNIKLEEFTQVMRGKSKWIKH